MVRWSKACGPRPRADLAIVAAPQDCVYVTDTVDWILDSIEGRTYSYVADIMAADTLAQAAGRAGSNAYYNSLWNSTGAFTHAQFQDATEMVASAWYSAWVDAGSPALTVVPEPTTFSLLAIGLLAFAPKGRFWRSRLE